ncbi:MAG: isopentenyl-diphosphate Delta-isomerase [Pseudanabaena sp. ELA607]
MTTKSPLDQPSAAQPHSVTPPLTEPSSVEYVILVDHHDEPIGVAEKLQAHRQGLLHRAFSIFVVNGQGQLLLQKRALAKYHSGGLWTNTCCSHPRPQETIAQAATRRLDEEMGIACDLTELFSFIYQADLDHGLVEYEFDHVLLGYFDGEPKPNPAEAEAWQWIDLDNLQRLIYNNPDDYTYWLRMCLNQFRAALLTKERCLN